MAHPTLRLATRCVFLFRIPQLTFAFLFFLAMQLSVANAQWTTSGNDVYKTPAAGKVGVGTTNPRFPLQVNTAIGGQIESMIPGSTVATFGVVNSTDVHGLYFGIGSSGNAWLQVARHDGSTATYDLVLQASGGKVGVGTITPSEKLHVVGNGKFTGNLIVDGNIAAKFQDLAEWVETSQVNPAGTVVVLDDTKSNQVVASTQAYDTRVAGVISDQPGIALGEAAPNRVLVATTGRVRIKVDATSGPIRVGDLLVTSDIPGVAMKSQPVSVGSVQLHRPGTLIGKALEPLPQGRGTIMVLLSLQ
jgi:hypothetical protein